MQVRDGGAHVASVVWSDDWTGVATLLDGSTIEVDQSSSQNLTLVPIVNSFGLARAGEWTITVYRGAFELSQKDGGSKGEASSASTAFGSWDAVMDHCQANGLPAEWSQDWFGGWVLANDGRRVKRSRKSDLLPGPQVPCVATYPNCGRPAMGEGEFPQSCKLHAAGLTKRAANRRKRSEASKQRQVETDRRVRAAEDLSELWSRVCESHGLDAERSGDVRVSADWRASVGAESFGALLRRLDQLQAEA